MSHMSDRGPGPHSTLRGAAGSALKGDAILANLHALGPVTKHYSERRPLAALVFQRRLIM